MRLYFPLVIIGGLCLLPSCMDDNDEDYSSWKQDNDKYVEQQAAMTNDDGTLFYERIVPDWSTGTSILIHWYNDRSATDNRIPPLFNSWTKVKYHVSLCDGTPVDSSYLRKDSVYSSRPSSNIVGWQVAVMNMCPGDSCRVIIPAKAAYGSAKNGLVKPYSALVYEMKLVDVTAYEIPQ